MNTKFKLLNAARLLLVFGLVCNMGCAKTWKVPKMFSLDNTWPFRDKDAPQEGTPVRMVGTWTDTVMTQPGKKPIRGFGGRIMFYEHEGKKPILVDGQLVVYAFDEDGRDPTDNKPTRRYVFPADQVAMRMSKSDLGASYSFFLPWDDAGGPKTEVSLICRFEPKSGGVVTGEQTRHMLPGPVGVATLGGAKQPPKLPEGVPSKPVKQSLESIRNARLNDHNATQASYEVPVLAGQQFGTPQSPATPEKTMTATTIQLPSNFQLPDAASLNMAAMAAGYQQAGQQLPQQYGANAVQAGASMRPAMATVLGAPLQQQAALGRPYMNQQLPQQMPMRAGAPIMPGPQGMVTGPTGWNNMTAGQLPQPQMQQPMVGQPMVGQPMMGQPMMGQPMVGQPMLPQPNMQQQLTQQQMMQPAMAGQQSWPQMAAQPGALNYPAQGQYR
jgi:hypothetical protein